MISNDELAYKFKNEIHANEIVLLAYYIAAINIEQVYHNIMGGEYVPFEGICLTDTFALYEKDDLVSEVMADNSTRRRKQKKLDIRVIVGNPPYSAGQTSANDNNANIGYASLDASIRNTYAAHSTATNKNALYDSYIRSIRWASDRIGTSGVVAYVSNGGFIDANTADGLRKCLVDEFSNIYIFHLRVEHVFDATKIVTSLYRPFTKQWLYFDSMFNHRPYRMPSLYPNGIGNNLTISLTGLGSAKDFSAVISNVVPDIQLHANGQCFPFKVYETHSDESNEGGLFDYQDHQSTNVKDGITDEGLKHFVDAYKGASISKEDLFYYVYGLLHSTEYKVRYADNLSKELPRIPAVKKFEDFKAFSEAGRKLYLFYMSNSK